MALVGTTLSRYPRGRRRRGPPGRMSPFEPVYRATLLVVLVASLAVPTAGHAAPMNLTEPPDLLQRGGPALPQKLSAALEALEKGDPDRALTLAREFVKEAPKSVEGRQVLAAAALAKGDLAEAEAAANEALRIDGKQARTIVLLAQILDRKNDPKRAESELRRAIQMDPRLSLAHRLLARILVRQGRLGEAVTVAEQGLRASGGGDLSDAHLVGLLYFEQGRLPESEQLLARVVAARPDHHQASLMLGLVKLGLLKIDEAAPLLERAAAREPTSPWARLGAALVARSRGQYTQATSQLEALAKDRPDWPMAHMQLAETLLVEKKADAAMRAFERAEQASPNKAFAQLQVARVLLVYVEPDRALAKARAALPTPAAALAARGLIAQALLAKGDAAGAEKELQAGVAAAPKDIVPVLQLGRFYASQRRWPDALRQFEQASKLQPDSRDALVAQTEARLAMNQGAEAVQAAARVLKLEGESVQGWMFLAATQERAGRPADARESYEKALKKQPGQLGAGLALAALHQREKRPLLAAKLLGELAESNPQSPAPLIELGMLREREKDPAGSVTAYRQALQRDARNPIALNNLAVRLGADPKTRDEGAALAERAYQAAPRSAAIAETLGWIVFQKGDVDRAQKLLEQAVAGQPDEPTGRYHLAQVYAKRGKKAEARRELEAALKAPAFAEAADARKLFESLR